MQAYRSSSWRRVTLRDRIPPPTGVVSGPLIATRCVRMASRVASGSQLPTCLKAFSPASTSSQSIWRFPPDTFRTEAPDRLARGDDGVARDHPTRSEEHTSELQSRLHLVCRLLLEKKKKKTRKPTHNNASTSTSE